MDIILSPIVKASWPVSPAMREIQSNIAALYLELAELDATNNARANELISSIRSLEGELIEMRKAQAGFHSEM